MLHMFIKFSTHVSSNSMFTITLVIGGCMKKLHLTLRRFATSSSPSLGVAHLKQMNWNKQTLKTKSRWDLIGIGCFWYQNNINYLKKGGSVRILKGYQKPVKLFRYISPLRFDHFEIVVWAGISLFSFVTQNVNWRFKLFFQKER